MKKRKKIKKKPGWTKGRPRRSLPVDGKKQLTLPEIIKEKLQKDSESESLVSEKSDDETRKPAAHPTRAGIIGVTKLEKPKEEKALTMEEKLPLRKRTNQLVTEEDSSAEADDEMENDERDDKPIVKARLSSPTLAKYKLSSNTPSPIKKELLKITKPVEKEAESYKQEEPAPVKAVTQSVTPVTTSITTTTITTTTEPPVNENPVPIDEVPKEESLVKPDEVSKPLSLTCLSSSGSETEIDGQKIKTISQKEALASSPVVESQPPSVVEDKEENIEATKTPPIEIVPEKSSKPDLKPSPSPPKQPTPPPEQPPPVSQPIENEPETKPPVIQEETHEKPATIKPVEDAIVKQPVSSPKPNEEQEKAEPVVSNSPVKPPEPKHVPIENTVLPEIPKPQVEEPKQAPKEDKSKSPKAELKLSPKSEPKKSNPPENKPPMVVEPKPELAKQIKTEVKIQPKLEFLPKCEPKHKPEKYVHQEMCYQKPMEEKHYQKPVEDKGHYDAKPKIPPHLESENLLAKAEFSMPSPNYHISQAQYNQWQWERLAWEKGNNK